MSLAPVSDPASGFEKRCAIPSKLLCRQKSKKIYHRCTPLATSRNSCSREVEGDDCGKPQHPSAFFKALESIAPAAGRDSDWVGRITRRSKLLITVFHPGDQRCSRNCRASLRSRSFSPCLELGTRSPVPWARHTGTCQRSSTTSGRNRLFTFRGSEWQGVVLHPVPGSRHLSEPSAPSPPRRASPAPAYRRSHRKPSNRR